MLELVSRPAYASCAEFLPRIDGAHLDCVSDALALLLAFRGVTDLVSPFGIEWRFDLVAEDGRFAAPALPSPRQADTMAKMTGWRPMWFPVTAQSPIDWQRHLRDGQPIAIVADAYHLPWVPYAGHVHMEHGFVLDGLEVGEDATTVYIADPYDNITEWGRAIPQTAALGLDELSGAFHDSRWAILQPAERDSTPDKPADVIARNAYAILTAGPAYAAFIEQYAVLDEAALDHLALQTWLLHRDRAVHAQWMAEHHPATAAVFEPVLSAWQRATEATYLALRRVRRGRPAPAGPIESLRRAVEAEQAAARALLHADDIASLREDDIAPSVAPDVTAANPESPAPLHADMAPLAAPDSAATHPEKSPSLTVENTESC